MDQIKRGILTLIRCAIEGKSDSLPEGFSLEEAYPFVRDGQVITLVYEGALLCGMERSNPAMKQLRQDYCRQLFKSEKQMQMLSKIYTVFDENGIDYMPVKGSVLKEQYPRPELRAMGDADILIKTEQYSKIKPLMEALGLRETSETDHELVWVSQDLYLELHKRVVPAHEKDFYRYFGNGWKLAKRECGNRYGLSDEDTMVYLFTHFAKHYRGGGIGCRHVADLWVYRRAHPELDEAYIVRALEELKLLEFYQNILKMLEVWFDGAKTDEKSEYLTNVFFKGTYFGTREEHMISGGARNAKRMKNHRLGKLIRIRRGLLPGYLYMSKKYPVLKKCPVLLPVLWVWRLITAVLFRRNNLNKLQNELQLTNADNVGAFRKGLEYVGLDFHFEE